MVERLFEQSQLEAIARALGDTDNGLTGPEIAVLIAACRMNDLGPITKRDRICNAFADVQNRYQHRRHILEFVRQSMKPERHLQRPERFELMRTNLNRALAVAGIGVSATGDLTKIERASTLAEARQRANDLRADLQGRGVHPDVLRFCKEELLADNYFHAVLEAVKSVADKIRGRTGLTDDGSALVDRALGGLPPMLAINLLQTESDRSEQKGFANLIKGTFGMFRNTTAHEAKVHWAMDKADAEDLLSLVSLIHRRLDAASMPARV